MLKRGTSKKYIRCSECGRRHVESLSNCCWIDCECGAKICGRCGSTNIVSMPDEERDDESDLWCFSECADCNLRGCSMCI